MEPFETMLVGDKNASICLLEPVGDYSLTEMEEECRQIKKAAGRIPFCLAGFYLPHDNGALSPWKAPAAFKDSEPFGDGAEETLRRVVEEVLPNVRRVMLQNNVSGGSEGNKDREIRFILGGYSLAGLFSFWSAYQTDVFEAVCAVSPSVWFPGWCDYQKIREPKAKHIYLSLGKKESKTRNILMAPVAQCMEESFTVLQSQGVNAVLEWNNGNHYFEVPQRKAKGYAWAISQITEAAVRDPS